MYNGQRVSGGMESGRVFDAEAEDRRDFENKARNEVMEAYRRPVVGGMDEKTIDSIREMAAGGPVRAEKALEGSETIVEAAVAERGAGEAAGGENGAIYGGGEIADINGDGVVTPDEEMMVRDALMERGMETAGLESRGLFTDRDREVPNEKALGEFMRSARKMIDEGEPGAVQSGANRARRMALAAFGREFPRNDETGSMGGMAA